MLLLVPATGTAASRSTVGGNGSPTAAGWPVYSIVNPGGRPSLVGRIQPPTRGKWDVDDTRGPFGYAVPSSNGRWQAYQYLSSSSSLHVGFASRVTASRWNIYDPNETLNGQIQSVGYVSRSNAGRWDLYNGYARVGYVSGVPAGVAAAAAFLLFIPH